MSKTDSSPEVSLFARHLAGDDAAFLELFHRWNHKLYLYCLKLLNDASRAEDITQELWEKVIRLRVTQGSVDNPVGFLLRIARNLCLNHLRAAKREIRLTEEAQGSLRGTESTLTDFEDAVVCALQALSPEDREVLVFSVYWGYSMQEIASLTNKSIDAVCKRASRARQRLRKEVLRIIGEDTGWQRATKNS